jgi:LysR family hydrogen peroxide-inducible transcriptional activator
MELQQLRYLVAVAETGNFTRASERCGVSQPSLSQQVINLEKELGQKLFHRLGRKAVLTEAGSAFLDRSRRILFEIEDATKELGDRPNLERRITVGAISTLAPYILPVLIERCRSRHPNLQINGHENFRSSLVNLVLEGVLDLAVVALPVVDPRIHVELLFREPLLLVVAKDHPLASRAEVTAADLAEENFVMLGSSSSLAAQVQGFCGDHHFQPQIAFRCAQVSTVKALVGMGAGISILPRVAQAPDDRETLAYASLADAAPVREVAVIRHMQRYQSRGAEQFLALLREMAKELEGKAP